MNNAHFTRYAAALRHTLGSANLISLGRTSRHCRRLRDVTPQRLVCSLLESLGAFRVQTVADILRTFNAQTGLRTQYKAFYNQLAKPEFPRFMRAVFLDLLRNMSQNVLRPVTEGRLAFFKDVVVQDGSSFAVHDALARTFGGRFTTIKPAAVEVHAFLSIFRDQLIRVQVAADKETEMKFLPPPVELRDKLLLADRGYESLDYWARVQAAGGHFVIRGRHHLKPRILRLQAPRGRCRRFEGHRVRDVLGRLPRRCLDLEVEWTQRDGSPLRLRMVLLWIPTRRQYLSLVTSVPRRVLSARQVIAVYRLRWQVELLFKEWKSYANLHKFTSANPWLVEGLIWASLCAAALKRTVAHASHRTGKNIPISTRIVAMCAPFFLPDIMRSALDAFRTLETVLQHIFVYLWANAARAHPRRDRIHGRMHIGLRYVGFTA